MKLSEKDLMMLENARSEPAARLPSQRYSFGDDVKWNPRLIEGEERLQAGALMEPTGGGGSVGVEGPTGSSGPPRW